MVEKKSGIFYVFVLMTCFNTIISIKATENEDDFGCHFELS